MMRSKNWKNTLARDTMVLGGLPFYFIVAVRAVIGQFAPFVTQLVIALIVILILSRMIKNSDQYIARALVLVVFTSIFYKDSFFTVFASLLWLMMIISALYLKVKSSEISKGIFIGIIAAIISHYLTPVIIQLI